MAKRVSMKGKGADLFFGEDDTQVAAGAATDQPAPDTIISSDLGEVEQVIVEPDVPESKHASKQARKTASSSDSTQASKRDMKQADEVERHALDVQTLDTIWPRLVSPATVTNSFRYTAEELQALEDALYEISKQHAMKLTKQDVARLGLNAVLGDYRARGDDSLLTTFAMRKKRQRGGL